MPNGPHPLAIDERAGFSTDLKLAVIDPGPAPWCRHLLSGSNSLQITTLAARDHNGGCGWSTAFHLDSSNGVFLNGGQGPTEGRASIQVDSGQWACGYAIPKEFDNTVTAIRAPIV